MSEPQEIQSEGTEIYQGTPIENQAKEQNADHGIQQQTSNPQGAPGTPDVASANPNVYDPQVDSEPDPNADATQNDDQVEQTDNSTTEEDGDQSDVDQNPVNEEQVQVEENTDGESAS